MDEVKNIETEREHSQVYTYEYRGWRHVSIRHRGGEGAFKDVIDEIEEHRSDGYEIVTFNELRSEATILFKKSEVE